MIKTLAWIALFGLAQSARMMQEDLSQGLEVEIEEDWEEDME